MAMSDRNRQAVMAAMDRLIDHPDQLQRSKTGDWTITQLAVESGVGRATINRDKGVVEVFHDRVAAASAPVDGELTGPALRSRMRQAEQRWGAERKKLVDKNELLEHAVEVLAHQVRDLSEHIAVLERERSAGNVTPLRFRPPHET